MNKILIIARHAHAADGEPGQPDKVRPLTAQGISEAQKSAAWLKEQQIKPDVMLVSPATRTQQTAAVYTENSTGNAAGFETETFLYNGSAKDILDFIKENYETEGIIMIVGHNPTVSDLAENFSNRIITYLEPAGIAVFEIQSNGWNELQYKPQKLIAQRNTSS